MKLIITDTATERHYRRLLRMIDTLREPATLVTVGAIKEALAENRKDDAAEAYALLESDEIRALWVAPSRGGVWSTQERHMMKHDAEWLALVHRYRGDDWYRENGI